MKTFLNILVVVVVISVIGGVAYVVWPRETIRHDFEPTATTTVSVITFETKTLTDESKEFKYTTSAEYPMFSGGIPQATTQINKTIDFKIKNEIGVFKKNATEFIKDLPAVLKESDEKSFIEIKFVVSKELLTKGIVSIQFPILYYQVSAAHPGHSSFTLNFDTKTGKVLELKDLFVGNYLETISARAIQKLKVKLVDQSDDETITSGASPKKENFESFYFTALGMHILFNDYQVAPYAAGPQEVVISYSELKEVIDPKGILNIFK